jgi:hypothetical protein
MATIDTIPVETAANAINRFQNIQEFQGFFQYFGPKAFTMELQELVNAANELAALKSKYNIDAVRVYLGQRKQWADLTNNGQLIEVLVNCLIMVPVQGYGGPGIDVVDIDGVPTKVLTSFPSQPGADLPEVTVTGTSSKQSLCYDFTYPCPYTCPPPESSILKYATN